MSNWSLIHDMHQQTIDFARDFKEAFGIDALESEKEEDEQLEVQNSTSTRGEKKKHPRVKMDPDLLWPVVVAMHMAFGVSPKKTTAMYGRWVTHEIAGMATNLQREAYKGIGCSKAVRERLQTVAGDDTKESDNAGEKELYGVDVVLEKADKFYTDWAKNVKAEQEAKQKQAQNSEVKAGARKSMSRPGKKR